MDYPRVEGVPLYEWLLQCTFPLEAKYADRAFTERVYTSLVDTLLANGTTTTVYFATVHVESTMRLADICLAKGQRALVGKVAMDDAEQCPYYYRDASLAAGIEGTRDLIAYVRAWRDADGPEDVLQKIIYNAGCDDIRKVWVRGRVVNEK